MIRKTAWYILFAGLTSLCGCGDRQHQQSGVVSPPEQKTFDELIEKHGCLACHLPGNRMKLPSWRDVARRYKGNREAVDYLASKIAQGGFGAWGTMGMPPYPEISEADLKVLAQGILDSDTSKAGENASR